MNAKPVRGECRDDKVFRDWSFADGAEQDMLRDAIYQMMCSQSTDNDFGCCCPHCDPYECLRIRDPDCQDVRLV